MLLTSRAAKVVSGDCAATQTSNDQYIEDHSDQRNNKVEQHLSHPHIDLGECCLRPTGTLLGHGLAVIDVVVRVERCC